VVNYQPPKFPLAGSITISPTNLLNKTTNKKYLHIVE